jgi:hypothetical protein
MILLRRGGRRPNPSQKSTLFLFSLVKGSAYCGVFLICSSGQVNISSYNLILEELTYRQKYSDSTSQP